MLLVILIVLPCAWMPELSSPVVATVVLPMVTAPSALAWMPSESWPLVATAPLVMRLGGSAHTWRLSAEPNVLVLSDRIHR